MQDQSKPGDRRRQMEERRAAELRLQSLIESQYRRREEMRRQGAADALFGSGDKALAKMD